jgi:hypothetical protein
MEIQLIKTELNWLEGKTVQGFAFIPDPSIELKPSLGLMTHGYTSHKGSILNWATRLAEEGMASLLFDLPGHYLGSFTEVTDLKVFQNNAHCLFSDAYIALKDCLKEARPLDEHLLESASVVTMGHSLGGLLALKALKLPQFQNLSRQAIAVGLGMAPIGQTHLFNSAFYKSTLHIRSQLVSPALHPDIVFPWIKKEKDELVLGQEKIHLITGLDDLVVGDDGTERLQEHLIQQENHVTIERPTKLPHHQPEMGAGHVKKFLKKEKFI